MTTLPKPPTGYDPEWAAQNNRLLEAKIRGLSNLEQRVYTTEQTLSGDLEAITALSGTGTLERTGVDTWALYTVTTQGKALIDDATAADQRTTLGLGTIATQNANAVAITGGTINGTTIGATTPSTGAFTTLTTTGNATLGDATTDVHEVSGSLGIGQSPSFQLHVSSASETGMQVTYQGVAASRYKVNSSGNIIIGLDGANGDTERVQVTTGGTAVTGTLSTTGNVTLGNDNGDVHTVNGSLSGTTTISAAGAISSTTGAGTTAFQMQPTARFYFDGGSNTWIEESAADTVSVFTNNSARLAVSNTGAAVTGALSCTGNATLGDASTDTVEVAGRIYTLNGHNNAGGISGTTQQWIASMTYTPTGTGVTNVTSVTPAKANVLRVARVVTVTGTVDVSPTAGSATTTFRLSLPIASSLAGLSDLAGAAAFIAISTHGPVVCYADTTNDQAFFSFTSASTSTHSITYSYSYEVL